jgi:hypothetical protein
MSALDLVGKRWRKQGPPGSRVWDLVFVESRRVATDPGVLVSTYPGTLSTQFGPPDDHIDGDTEEWLASPFGQVSASGLCHPGRWTMRRPVNTGELMATQWSFAPPAQGASERANMRSDQVSRASVISLPMPCTSTLHPSLYSG